MHEHEGTLWERYLDLLTNPEHLLYELTLVLVIDVVLAGILWPLVKRAIRRHDEEFHS